MVPPVKRETVHPDALSAAPAPPTAEGQPLQPLSTAAMDPPPLKTEQPHGAGPEDAIDLTGSSDSGSSHFDSGKKKRKHGDVDTGADLQAARRRSPGGQTPTQQTDAVTAPLAPVKEIICADFRPVWAQARDDALRYLMADEWAKRCAEQDPNKLSFPPRFVEAEHFFLETIFAFMRTRPTALVAASGTKFVQSPLRVSRFCSSERFSKMKNPAPYQHYLCREQSCWLMGEEQFSQCATALRHFMADLAVPNLYQITFASCQTPPAKHTLCIKGKTKSKPGTLDADIRWWFLKFWQTVPDSHDPLVAYCLYDLVEIERSSFSFA